MSRMHSKEIESLLKKYEIENRLIDSFNSMTNDKTFIDDNIIYKTIVCSNSIENEEMLTIEDTKIVVKDYVKNNKIKINNKSADRQRKLIENTFNSYNYLYELIESVKILSINNIKTFHSIIMEDIDVDKTLPGYFSSDYRTIAGHEETISFTSPDCIHDEMLILITDINKFIYKNVIMNNINKLNCVLDFKRRFIRIHQFNDSNGRTSRALMQYLLYLSDLPMCAYYNWDRNVYKKGMQLAYVTKGNMDIIKYLYLMEVVK